MSNQSSRDLFFSGIAFVVASLVAALSLTLAGFVRQAGVANVDPLSLYVWTFFAYMYTTLATVVFALPAFLVLRRLSLVRWWTAAAVGLCIGVLLLVIVSPRGFSAVIVEPQAAVLWGGVGMLSAFVFWLVWRQGQRPTPAKP